MHAGIGMQGGGNSKCIPGAVGEKLLAQRVDAKARLNAGERRRHPDTGWTARFWDDQPFLVENIIQGAGTPRKLSNQ
jgi:hypothetical protein